MKPEAIKYEVLFLTNSGSAGKHACTKKCHQAEKCAARLHHITTQAKLFTRSMIFPFEKFKIENFDISLTVIFAKRFIHLSVGDLLKSRKPLTLTFFFLQKLPINDQNESHH